MATEVYLEVADKRVFACAYDWPGWCRSGRDENTALEALASYLPRYAAVTKAAHVRAPALELTVVERVPGSAGTSFGVPGSIAERDGAVDKRILSLVRAAWTVFDDVVAGAPAELRKGPRGGGRDRDKMVDHVYGAEAAYGRGLGIKLAQPKLGDASAVAEVRAALLEALEHPREGAKWPPAYGARRIAWHALDHAWEMEDRSS